MPEGVGDIKTVGIIGGLGQFGRWFQRILENSGVEVLISDLGEGLSPSELATRSQAIIVAVPIGVTETVLSGLIPFLKKDHIIVDLTSVKTPFLPLLQNLPCNTLSIHPMFAPTPSHAGQTCIVIDTIDHPRSNFFTGLLQKEGIRLVSMGAEVHDRMMAVVQGLTHFQAIASAHAMQNLGVSFDTTLDLASPVYRLRLAMVGRILAQNPRLYAEIQIFNPYVREVLAVLEQSSSRLKILIDERDVEGFIREFELARQILGKYREQALAESELLISALSTYTRNLPPH